MGAWGKDAEHRRQGADARRRQRRLHQALGLELDLTGFGMGMRSKRYAMVVDNGVVKALNVEAPGAFEVSSADAMLKAL